jgi:hypothetical protein
MEESTGLRGAGGYGGLDAQIEQLMECHPLPEPEVRGTIPFSFALVVPGSSSGGIQGGLGWAVSGRNVLGLSISEGQSLFLLVSRVQSAVVDLTQRWRIYFIMAGWDKWRSFVSSTVDCWTGICLRCRIFVTT